MPSLMRFQQRKWFPTPSLMRKSIPLLLRKFNRKAIDKTAFDTAKSALRAELINDPDFVLLTISDIAFYDGITFVEKHNLNATDAALLILYRAYLQEIASDDTTFLLIAADERMVRAAQAEGLPAVNPEALAATDVAGFLSALSQL